MPDTDTTTANPLAALEELIARAAVARDELLALADGDMARLGGQIAAMAERYGAIRRPLDDLEARATEELTRSVAGSDMVNVRDAIATVVAAVIDDPCWELLATMRDTLGDAIGDPS